MDCPICGEEHPMGRNAILFQFIDEQGNFMGLEGGPKDGQATVYRCDNCETEFALIPKEDVRMIMRPLLCNDCGERIGWVHTYDLQGSSFYCDDCANGRSNEGATGDAT